MFAIYKLAFITQKLDPGYFASLLRNNLGGPDISYYFWLQPMKALYRKYKYHYSANLKLATPIIVSQLGHTLVQFSDSVIVGHFAGTVCLAAVSLVNSIFVIPMVIGLGISLWPYAAPHRAK